MPVDRKIVQQQLEALGDFYQFFTSKEIRFLPQILAENETIHGLTSGLYEGKTWIIVITDMRLLFLDKGMLYGLRQIDMPLSQISSISHKSGLFFGELQVSTASGAKCIGSIAKKDVLKLCSIISGLIHGSKKKPVSNEPIQASRPVDLTTQLEKLFILREKGALTEEEYALTKSKLLNSDLL